MLFFCWLKKVKRQTDICVLHNKKKKTPWVYEFLETHRLIQNKLEKSPLSRLWIPADSHIPHINRISKEDKKKIWKATRAVLPLQPSCCLSLYASISQESVRLRYHLCIRRSHLPSPFSTVILFAFNMHSSPLNSSSCVQLQCRIPGRGRRRVINEIDLFGPLSLFFLFFILFF